MVLRLWWRGIKAPAYRANILERFGFVVAITNKPCIWVHAVSVGETIASQPLIEQLLEQYPQYHIHISSMTPTGRQEVHKRFGGRVSQSYAPYDFPLFVKLFLSRVNPSVMLVMETELWPNIVHQCRKQGIKTALINGRLSERSAKGYKKINALSRPMLQSLNLVAAQFKSDADRFKALGVADDALHEIGNIKFDIHRPNDFESMQSRLRQQIIPDNVSRPIIIVASTHEGEDEYLLPMINTIAQQSDVKPLWLWVPRHPERFDRVAQLIEQQQLSYCRRSTQQIVSDQTVYLADTMGELACLYAIADIAIIGGSFIERGGHNMLEAALWDLPIVTGSSDFNFSVVSKQLQAAEALQQCDDQTALINCMVSLLNDTTLREKRGLAARAVLEKNQGSLQKTLGLLGSLIDS